MGQLLQFQRPREVLDDEPFMPGALLAEKLQVTPRTIHNWHKLGMPSKKIGRQRLYQLERCTAWAEDYGRSL